MLLRDITDKPWKELATYYFTHNNKDYLLIADPFSKYQFIFRVHSKTLDSLVQCLQDLFSQYGPLKHFFSDKGLPFSSETFSKFLSTQGIDHITSSPSIQNLMASLHAKIKTIKTSLTTTKASGILVDHLLRTIRYTPIGPNYLSSHKILHNCTDECPGLPSRLIDFEVRKSLISKMTHQKDHHNRRHKAHTLSDLHSG